jgi:hypothetical protein
MPQALRPSALVPRGLVVDGVSLDGAVTVIAVRAVGSANACPECRTNSERVHSRYHRRLADLPMAGRSVRLMVCSAWVKRSFLPKDPRAESCHERPFAGS